MAIKKLLRRIVYRFRGEYTTEQLVKRGLAVGKNFHRLNHVIIDPAHCWLIEIGDNVTLAPRVHILAHDASTKQYLGYTKIGKVKIGSNVFVGAESVILPDVSIGDNVIIGANSTVTRDVTENTVVAGSPAKTICTLEEYVEKNRDLMALRPVFDRSYTLNGGVTQERKFEMKKELRTDSGFVE